MLDELAQLAARQIGLRIPDDARGRFAGILRARAECMGCASLKSYRAFLTGGQATGEWEWFARTFTSGESFFFRDHGQFDLLRLRLLPELIARHRDDKNLRLWSAGCAGGEEVYSLAILVDMLLPDRGGWDVHILGTDIDFDAIARAQRGRYGQWSFRMVPTALQQRYFRPENGEWLLDERIRRMVTLRVSNLVREPFPDAGPDMHDMDLILCRNVFIYFTPASVSAVATRFAAALREGGYLMTAHAELIGHPVRGLESRLFAGSVVYRRGEQSPAPCSDESALPLPSPPPQAGEEEMPPPLHAQRAGEGWGGGSEALFEEARVYADRGEYGRAEQMCRRILSSAPLAAAPYFLLAQLAQLGGDFRRATELLNKALYVDPRFVAAHLELAALCERAGDMHRAQALRRAALSIVRAMPGGERVEQYETTAGELAQWLAQLERGPDGGRPEGAEP